MAPSDSEKRSPEEGRDPRKGDPISFVQRLREHYGEGLDPEINLQETEDSSELTREGGERDSDESSSRGLYRRLSSQPGSAGMPYRVIKEIARGGMGTILSVWDADLRRKLAMKVMLGRDYVEDESGSVECDSEKLGRFLEEAQITGQLDHPGIVPVHSLGIDSQRRVYFTMRLVRGRELKEVFELARERKENWTTTKVLGLILKVCEAMAFAHSKGVVHRDLKPANVMVGRFGETYVMDWGLARVLGRQDSHDIRLRKPEDASALTLVRTVRKDESLNNPDSPLVTMDGDVVGTPSYMAPEQAQGQLDKVGPRSDVYSLGSILYYMLTGRAPYVKPGERVSAHTVLNRVLQGPPIPVERLTKDEPEELIAICRKAMARDPGERYAGMLEVADDIQAFLENRVVGAYEGGSIAEFRKWVVRNSGMAAAIAGLILLSIASALGFAWQKGRRVEAILEEQALTDAARIEAQENARQAQANARQALDNLDLALRRQAEADHNASVALENEMLARSSGYAANIIAADFSLRLNDVKEATGRLAACDEELRKWEWGYLSLRAQQSLRTFSSGRTVLSDVTFGPSSETLMYVIGTGRFRRIDADSGEPLPPEDIVSIPTSLSALTVASRDLAVSRDGSRIALVGAANVVQVYDLADGSKLFDLPPERGIRGHEETVRCAAFSPGGRWIASGSADGVVILWDAESATLQRRLFGHSDEVRDVAWSEDAGRLASASLDGTLRVWNTRSGEEELVLRGHSDGVLSVDWNRSGERIVSGSLDETLILWDAIGGRLERVYRGHVGAVNAVDFHPDEDRLLSAGEDYAIRLWEISSRAATLLHGHQAGIVAASFSPDGSRIVSGDHSNEIRIWDARGDLSSTRTLCEEPVRAAAYHPDGSRFAIGDSEGGASILDAYSGEVLAILRGHEKYVTSIAFSPDGRTLMTGSGDKSARLWDVESGRQLKSFGPHDKWVGAVAYAPDGSWVATGSGKGLLRVWDPETGELLRTLSGHKKWIKTIAVHPHGTHIAAGGGDKSISIWKIWEETPSIVLPGHDRPGIVRLVFDATGKLFSAGSTDSTARAWDVETGECEQIFWGHDKTVTALDVNQDGTRIVTGSPDTTIRIWDVLSGGALLTLRAHQDDVPSVEFSPDDARILSVSADRSCILWETGEIDRRLDARSRAQELRALAEPLLDDLFAEHFYLEEVALRLRADPDLDAELRDACLRLAAVRGDDPGALDRLTRKVVLFPGHAQELYEQALRRALAACSLDREDPHLLSTLGIAQYRTADHENAARSLSRAWADNARLRGDERFEEADEIISLSYLAMAQYRNGELGEALSRLESARAKIEELPEEAAAQGDALAALREAESLLEERRRPAGSSGG